MKPAHLVIHPSCPKKLVSALRRQKWNQSALARELKVNKGVINKLLHRGIEPHSIELRLKVFLPKHPRKRYGECGLCGKGIELALDGTLTSHSHPDGSYCPASDTRQFLSVLKIKRNPNQKSELPPHRKWWNKRSRAFKDSKIREIYLTANG